ncbi:MAG: lipase family protein, partial [Planctomycetota bacterium]
MDFDNGWEALVDPGKAADFFALSGRRRPDFVPDRSAWDLGQAWWLAELSRVIYCGEGRQALLQAAGLREQQFFTAGSTQCAIVGPEAGDAFGILAFRGTDELRDWLANLRAVPAIWPQGGNVHRGFRRAFRKVWDEVHECMESGSSMGAGQTPW